MHNYEQAAAYIAALTQQDPSAVIIDARMIHDQKKDIPAIPMRGTLPELWQSIIYYQQQGYGAFVNISDMDGNGRLTENVRATRVQVIDLDSAQAIQNYHRAVSWYPAPQFAVESSPGKYHIYWNTDYSVDFAGFQTRQRKLAQFFDGDKRIIDPARVLRIPGTFHLKAAPHMIQCWTLAGWGHRTPIEVLDGALAHVHVHDLGSGGRHALGDAAMAAPSLEWIERALLLTDPNRLDRGDWIAVTAAVKQSGWNLADEATLRAVWENWCARYDGNDPGENLKQWNSLRDTEVGWNYLKRRIPQLTMESYTPVAPTFANPAAAAAVSPIPESISAPPPLDCSGEILTTVEQKEWFKDCTFVSELTRIMTPNCMFLNSAQFNAMYGGKLFIITDSGKTTDEAWKAVTRGTGFRIPSVEHIRFMPNLPYGEIIEDNLGRRGINTYKPAKIRSVEGDPSPFLRHIGFMLPDANDQRILLDYLAHNIKFPGYKIPWAPVIQSNEGAGKGIMKYLMSHCVGDVYMHTPNTKDLAESGQKFNAWMRNKLFILADEIKVDDRRDMIEVLKPMISEERIEVQAKGFDQKTEDNFANWLFFTNYKDAVPINQNSRRFAIFYSAFQKAEQLVSYGLDSKYFDFLYGWLKKDGAAIMMNYFMNYPIERGGIPMRAPETSSKQEVIGYSLGPVERAILDAIEDGVPGFRGGWVSSAAVRKKMVDLGIRSMSINSVEKIIESLGYARIGRAASIYVEEDHKAKSMLFNKDSHADVAQFGPLQGYR